MSVFGGQSQTEIATGLQNPDYSLTTNWGPNAKPPDKQIATDTWLPGTTGVDCKLVHGDRWQKIDGNMSQHVAQGKTSTYDGDFTETYNGTVTRTMNGYVGESYCATAGCDRTYTGHATDTYLAGHSQHNHIEEFEVRLAKFEIVDTLAFEVHPFKFEASHTEINAAGIHCHLGGLEASFHYMIAEGAALKREFFGLKQESAALEEKIDALKSKITALSGSVRNIDGTVDALKVITTMCVLTTVANAIVAEA